MFLRMKMGCNFTRLRDLILDLPYLLDCLRTAQHAFITSFIVLSVDSVCDEENVVLVVSSFRRFNEIKLLYR